MQVFTTLHTDGRGYWSNVRRAVDIEKLQLSYVNEEHDFGELCVYFAQHSWHTDTDGLIYTDKQFMQELRTYLQTLGFTEQEANDVSYSEQGMQGDDYVSCDVGKAFINGLIRLDAAHVEEAYAGCK